MLDCYDYMIFSPDVNDTHLLLVDNRLLSKIRGANPNGTETLNTLADELID